MMEGSVDILHECDAFRGEIGDEFGKSGVIESSSGEGDDINIEPEFPR
jgi:hypothetical protein